MYTAVPNSGTMLNSMVLFNAIPDTNHNANPTNPNTRYREFGTAVYRFADVCMYERYLGTSLTGTV